MSTEHTGTGSRTACNRTMFPGLVRRGARATISRTAEISWKEKRIHLPRGAGASYDLSLFSTQKSAPSRRRNLLLLFRKIWLEGYRTRPVCRFHFVPHLHGGFQGIRQDFSRIPIEEGHPPNSFVRFVVQCALEATLSAIKRRNGDTGGVPP